MDVLYQYLWLFLAPLAFIYRRSFIRNNSLIAVVGSLGKTTTVRAVTAALAAKSKDNRRLYRNSLSYVATAVLKTKPSDRQAVIEVGIDRPGQMSLYAKVVKPDIVVVTSIATEHMRSLKSLEATRKEKAEMVKILSGSGIAVLNGDDANVMWMKSQTKAKVITFGFGKDNDVRAEDLIFDWPLGMKFILKSSAGSWSIKTRLLGRHMIYPLLAAWAVAFSQGYLPEEILPRLQELYPTPGRLEVIPLENGAYLLRDDFKSALETIYASLDVLAEIPAERKFLVLGDVSEPPGSVGDIYRQIGRRIAAVATKVIIVSGNFQRYATGATHAGFPRQSLLDADKSMIKVALELKETLIPGDVVLVKGRSTQRLDRFALLLQGRNVKCDIRFCDNRALRCDECPMLEKGWGNNRVVT